MPIRTLLAACAAVLLGLPPLVMADIPSPPPQGIRGPMRVVEGQGYAALDIPKSVILEPASSGLPAADVAPPPNSGRPITQIAGGALLTLGAIFLGHRLLRRSRNGSTTIGTAPGKEKPAKLALLAVFLWASLSLLTYRVDAQAGRGGYNSGPLARAVAGGALEGTAALRVTENSKGVVLRAGGTRGRARPLPPGSPK